jgi:hypothetical protein
VRDRDAHHCRRYRRRRAISSPPIWASPPPTQSLSRTRSGVAPAAGAGPLSRNGMTSGTCTHPLLLPTGTCLR